jgi:hypothetical protein
LTAESGQESTGMLISIVFGCQLLQPDFCFVQVMLALPDKHFGFLVQHQGFVEVQPAFLQQAAYFFNALKGVFQRKRVQGQWELGYSE